MPRATPSSCMARVLPSPMFQHYSSILRPASLSEFQQKIQSSKLEKELDKVRQTLNLTDPTNVLVCT